MTPEELKIMEKKYEVALATRNFEIELFWKRFLFFWGFIASSFVGYATIVTDKPSLAVVIACFGFVCSVAWSLVNRGSKYWQENWETIVANIEDDVTGSLFKERQEQKNKAVWLSSRKFSVSKVTIALSDFTVVIWFALMCYHLLRILPTPPYLTSDLLIISAVIFSVIYSIIMAVAGRSTDAKTHNKSLHRTAITLHSIAGGELGRYISRRCHENRIYARRI